MSSYRPQTPPHILQLNLKEKQDFLDSFDYVFFDCDGVIWLIVGTIPHANEGVNALKAIGKICKFVSNNSMRSEAEYLEKFRQIGVHDVRNNDIIHPAKSMIRYIKTHLPESATVFSICDRTVNQLLRSNGLNVKTLEITDYLTPAALADTVHLRGEKVNAVLCDINLNINYAQLARACLFLQQNDECHLIVGATDAVLPLTADLNVVGLNYIIAQLAAQTKSEPIVLGKPGKALSILLKEMNNIGDPNRVLFVGDSLNFDIKFAKLCGFQSLFVLTGTSSKEDMLAISIENRPDFYANGVYDFVQLLKDLKKI